MKRVLSDFLLLTAFLTLCLTASAKPRSFKQAQSIAERQAQKLGIVIDQSSLAKAPRLNGVIDDNTSKPYFVFPNGEEKGFTVVSGDDRFPEIVGYSDRGTYSEDKLPEGYVDFLQRYKEMVEAVEKGDNSALKTIAEARQMRTEGTKSAAVAPLLGDTQWGLDEPFNRMCPLYNEKYRSVTGCTATAMAQILAYWKYPEVLKSDIDSYETETYNLWIPTIYADEQTNYDWDNMLDSYPDGKYTDEQADAVAKLMYHCGAALRMDYGPVSGCYSNISVWTNYFGYDADLINYLYRFSFTVKEWSAIIDNELLNKRPIMYSGTSSTGGHAFVCDGADGNGLYHINWGWNGYQDGYFDITILNPEKGGTGSGTAADGYNRYGRMIIGIQPDNGVYDEPIVSVPSVYSFVTKESRSTEILKGTRDDVNGKFSIALSDIFFNNSDKDINGYVSYGIMNEDGSYTPIADGYEVNLLAYDEDAEIYDNHKCSFDSIDYAFPVGTYNIFPLFSEDSVTWRRCPDDPNSVYKQRAVEVTDTTLQVTETPLTAEIENTEEVIYSYPTDFAITLTNRSQEDFNGFVSVYASDKEDEKGEMIAAQYVSVPTYSSRVIPLMMTVPLNFPYLRVVEYSSGNTISSIRHFDIDMPIEPSISLVSVESNAEPGLYETEKAYHAGRLVKMPKTREGIAKFRFGLKNDGGRTTANYLVIFENTETGDIYHRIHYYVKTLGDGQITYINDSISARQLGGRCAVCSVYHLDEASSSYWYVPTSLPDWTLPYVDDPESGVSYKGCFTAVYIGDNETGVGGVDVESGIHVIGGKGEIVLMSDKTCVIPVYSAGGMKVCEVNVAENAAQRVAVKPGLYIVKNQKVIVQ